MIIRTATLVLLIVTLISGCAGFAPPPGGSLVTDVLPEPVDPAKRYLFYLHGRIIEDQGLPAISPRFGEYEYERIVSRLAAEGFVVISEPRPRGTDVNDYAGTVSAQIERLLAEGVPPGQITVVGASKGAFIAALTSHRLENEAVNFVLIATCHPSTIAFMKENDIHLHGDVLTIRDIADTDLAGPCDEIIQFSPGVREHREIVLEIGTAHGILYKPLDEWVIPTVEWAENRHISSE